ncbi:MAG: MotA/TolQ/ExbB proton channel family protein [Elusimicrobiaceae bacterium]|jgi:chemotaxis protein MotA
MDFSTIFGLCSLGGLIWLGIASGQLSKNLVNSHALFLVLCGSAIAIILNTPISMLLWAFKDAFSLLFNDPYSNSGKIVKQMVELAEECKLRGMAALKDTDEKTADGFLAHAADLALQYNDPDFVKEVLESEINTTFDANNERTNVFRTLSIMLPMFGLLGTLIGIIAVLKEVSNNPENTGQSMAIAISSALYGIALSNMVCLPIAGKLRIRNLNELKVKGIITVGMLEIIKGTLPIAIEGKLKAIK